MSLSLSSHISTSVVLISLHILFNYRFFMYPPSLSLSNFIGMFNFWCCTHHIISSSLASITDVIIILTLYHCFKFPTYLSTSSYNSIAQNIYTISNLGIPPPHHTSFLINLAHSAFYDLVWSIHYSPLCSALLVLKCFLPSTFLAPSLSSLSAPLLSLITAPFTPLLFTPH